jgi:hypothetical protein
LALKQAGKKYKYFWLKNMQEKIINIFGFKTDRKNYKYFWL